MRALWPKCSSLRGDLSTYPMGGMWHVSRCDRFQDVLMLECRIGLCAEQTKRVVFLNA